MNEDEEELSECCGAPRHHIYNDLCADCKEHCEFLTEEPEDEDKATSK